MIWVKSLWMSDFNLKDCFLLTFSGWKYFSVIVLVVFTCYTLYPFAPHIQEEKG